MEAELQCERRATATGSEGKRRKSATRSSGKTATRSSGRPPNLPPDLKADRPKICHQIQWRYLDNSCQEGVSTKEMSIAQVSWCRSECRASRPVQQDAALPEPRHASEEVTWLVLRWRPSRSLFQVGVW